MLRRAKKGGEDPSLSPQPPLPPALAPDEQRIRTSMDGARRPPAQYAPSGQPAYAYQQHQHPQQQHSHQQSYQSIPPQHRQQSPPPSMPQQATMGRSQSAFNFIFNKAKSPFSSTPSNVAIHQNASAMSSSPSLSSLPTDDGSGRYPSMEQRYHHAPQRSQAGGHPMNVGIPKSSSGGIPRHTNQSGQQGNRPSFGDEMLVSSPTKRSFFGRDRKMSTGQQGANVVNANQGGGSGSNSRQGGAYAHSPLGARPGRDAGGTFAMMGSAFSKSQSDLHVREASSPGSIGSSGNDYPPLRAPIPHDLEDPNFLRSPSPNIAFSRSVDDLSQSSRDAREQGVPTLRQPSPRQASGPSQLSSSHGDSSRPHGAHGIPGTWGEHGVMNSDWRPSDMGALNGPQARRGSPGPMSANSPYGAPGQHARSESLVAQPPLSNVSMMQPSPSLQPSHLGSNKQASSSNHRLQMPADSRHQRKGSKLPSAQASSSTSSLGVHSNSLGKAQGRAAGMADRMYQNLRAGSSSSSALPSGASSASTALPASPPPLPPGAIHQGFLSRNANVSLSFAQLSEHGREKDISKGWKPYRAVLRDGKILFFKPPSSAADEVKTLFPSGVVKGGRGAGNGDMTLDTDFLKKSGLGAQDLLAATSSSPALPTTPPFLPTKSRPSGSPARSPGAAERDDPVDAQVQVPNPAWTGFGVHPALVLVEATTPPPTWAARIYSATLDAFAHELVFATQQRLEAAPEPGDSKRSSIALVLNGNDPSNGTSASLGLEEKEAIVGLDDLIAAGLYCLASSGSSIEPLVKEIARWTNVALTAADGAEKAAPEAVNEEETRSFHVAVRARVSRFLQLAPVALVDAAPADRSRSIDVLEGIARSTFADSKPYIRALDHSATANLPATPPTDWLSRSPTEGAKPRPDLMDAQQRGYLAENTFLKLDPVEVAQQIQVFHAERLRCVASPRLTLGRFLPGRADGGTGSIGGGASAPVSPGGSPLSIAQQALTLFSFNSLTPHFLTKLILDQLLSRSGCKPADLGHRRVALLRHWIRIGAILSSLGDVAGWAAVSTALCSRAISRLEESWRLVPAQDRGVVGKIWAPMLMRLGWVDAALAHTDHTAPLLVSPALTNGAPQNYEGAPVVTIPYLGDAIVAMHREGNIFATTMSLNGLMIADNVDPARQLFTLVQRWAIESGAVPDEMGELSVPGIEAPVVEYQALWQTLHARQLAACTSGSAETARDRVAASLSLEPKSLGNLDLHYRPPLKDTLAFHAQAPLRFPEPLPHLGFGEYKLSRAREAALARSGGTLSPDIDGTITARSHARATLQGSAFTSGKSAAASNRAAFASVTEWAPSLPEVRALSLVPFQAAVSNGSSPTTPLSPSVGTSAGSGRLIRLGSDVIFRTVSSGADTSVPSSPRNSRRFSQDLATLTLTRTVTGAVRPTSLTSKRSSLPTSNRNSVVEMAPPLSVVVKAATLERLVDILVMDVHHINLEVGSSDGTLSPVRKSRLSMDLERYRINFLATFRSLCSPVVLLDFLRKRFLGAINASREMGLPAQHRRASQFPSWSMAPASGALAVEPIDWEIVTRIRTGVAQVLRLWAKRFAQDFVDDDDLFVGALAFLVDSSALSRVGEAEEASEENAQIRKVVNAIEEAQRTLRAAVFAVNAGKEAPPRSAQRLASVTLQRPPHRLSVSDKTPAPISGATSPLTTSSVLDIDTCTPVQLVEHFEMVAALFFDKVHERDLLIASEQLERQAASPTGWFVAAQPVYAAGDDETAPTNSMYKLLEFLRPVNSGKPPGSAGAPQSEAKYFSFWAQLPIALSQMGAAQRIITAWFGMQIIEPRIGVARRQARIEKLLDAAWICRARMLRLRSDELTAPPATSSLEGNNASPNAQAPFREATIASFLECAITGSLTSSESRAYHVAWQSIAAARNASGENLADLIPPPEIAATLLRDALDVVALSVTGVGTPTPDLGWLLCCLAETHTRPSDLDAADSALVNFDRYRTAWNLIDSALRFRPFDPSSIDIAMARYNVLVHAVSKMVLDRRAVREDAVLEASSVQPLPLHAAWRGRPFRPLVAFVIEQGEKGRRDRLAFEAAQAELRPAREAAAFEKAHASAAAYVQSGAGSSTLSAAPPSNQEKRTRRMTALFRGAVRPMGGLLSNSADKVDTRLDLPPRSAAELMALTAITSKPALVVPCTDAQINVWSNSQRSFIFHLASVEGGIKLLLQAPSLSEMTEWVSHIEKITKESAEARMLETRKAKGRKAIVGAPLYGIPLITLVEREGRDVPLAIERMFAEVEARGLREVGIYRISGAKSAIQNVRDQLNVQPAELIDLTQGDCADIHTITGATKQFFRDLPDPAIPFAFYHSFMEAERIPDNDARLYAMRDLVWDLPKPHFDLLRRTVEHLARVVEEGEHNLMAAHNLGLVFGPSLLNPPPTQGNISLAEGFGNIGKAAHIVKLLITTHEWLFEPEPELQADELEEGVIADGDVAAIDTAALDEDEESDGAAMSPEVQPTLPSTAEEADADGSVAVSTSGLPAVTTPDFELYKTPLDGAFDLPAEGASNGAEGQEEDAAKTEEDDAADEREEVDEDHEPAPMSSISATAPVIDLQLPSSSFSGDSPFDGHDLLRSSSPPIGSSAESLLAPESAADSSNIGASSEDVTAKAPSTLSPPSTLRIQRKREYGRAREESIYLDAHDALETLSTFQVQGAARPSADEDTEAQTPQTEEAPPLDGEAAPKTVADSNVQEGETPAATTPAIAT